MVESLAIERDRLADLVGREKLSAGNIGTADLGDGALDCVIGSRDDIDRDTQYRACREIGDGR